MVATYVGNGNRVVLANAVVTNVVKHVLDEHRALSNHTIWIQCQ